jgi:hypothetical protein
MATPFSTYKIDDIKNKIMRPSLTSHYLCNITLPSQTSFIKKRMENFGVFLGDSGANLYDNLSLACVEASLPGSSLSTIDIENDYHGVSEKHAYRRLYDDRVDFTFFVTVRGGHEYFVIKFFEAWIGYCVNEQYKDIAKSTYSYRVTYPDNYYSQSMSIAKFERDYDLTSIKKSGSGKALIYNFVNAFPISINSMPVTYEQSELLKCTVSFNYSRYYLTPANGLTPTSIPNSEAPAIPELSNTTSNSTNSISDSFFNFYNGKNTNEYYNNFGQRTQDATNTANFLGVG